PEWDAALVVDLFTGQGTHRFRTAWPLHPELNVHQYDTSTIVMRGGAPVLQVASAATAPCTLYAVRGEENERVGWWSHRFESRIPSWLIGALAEETTVPLVMATVLVAPPANTPSVTDLTVGFRNDQVEVTWRDADAHAFVQIDTLTRGAVTYQLSKRVAG